MVVDLKEVMEVEVVEVVEMMMLVDMKMTEIKVVGEILKVSVELEIMEHEDQ